MPAQPEWSGVLGSRWLAFQFGGFGLDAVLRAFYTDGGFVALSSLWDNQYILFGIAILPSLSRQLYCSGHESRA